ncbi:MAG: potD [Gammaproteobacteria bacterium]|jgi:spermidine/putrescine transport system substrate-binding protein|nr:potD [Gammaproteobacteria bacterium]
MRKILLFCLSFFIINAFANDEKVVNVYNWSDYLPDEVLQQFEKETGIHVNYSTYDNNETMYAKLKANPDVGYDIVVPSTYFIDRMRREKMLQPIDKKRLVGLSNMNPALMNKSYDPGNNYSIPYLVGSTGILYNDLFYPIGSINAWKDLWQEKYHDRLLLLDDVREIFSMALLVLGYSPDTTNPEQIKAAYQKLQALLPNVKLFNDEAVKAIYIDEDATIGMVWSGDAFGAQQENPHLHFVFPKEGYVLSQDSMAIPANAPHLANAYRFINFILRPEIAAKIAAGTGYSTPNAAAMKYLPEAMRNSEIMYPNAKILARAHFQMDVGDAADDYEKYLEQLKLSA